jgi:hypothetical protein
MRVNHWIGLEKDINRYRFYFLILVFNIEKSSIQALNTKMPLILLLVCVDYGLYVHKPRERQQLFVSEEFRHPAIQ